MGKLHLEEEISEKETTAIKALKELNTDVTLNVIHPIEHSGQRYEVGSTVTLPWEYADFHIQNGNCKIAK